MRDCTRGTISTRSLKRSLSTLAAVPAAEAEDREDWVRRWIGEELSSPESQDLGSPRLELSCKSMKCCGSNIVFLNPTMDLILPRTVCVRLAEEGGETRWRLVFWISFSFSLFLIFNFSPFSFFLTAGLDLDLQRNSKGSGYLQECPRISDKLAGGFKFNSTEKEMSKSWLINI